MAFGNEADFTGKKGVPFGADAEERHGKERRPDVFVVAGEENRSADGNHQPGADAAYEFLQHIVIFSADSSIFPMT